tara:strand:- start:8865 stop:9302 length:438 start_codon:yes stop_codon:yes gene_type:complete
VPTNKKGIHKNIVIRARPEELFEALTSSDQIVQYYPVYKVESSWRVGEPVIYQGFFQDIDFVHNGYIEKLIFPYTYQYKYWSDYHGTENILDNYISISYIIKPIKNGSHLFIKQKNIPAGNFFNYMNKVGWDSLLRSLKKYIERK